MQSNFLILLFSIVLALLVLPQDGECLKGLDISVFEGKPDQSFFQCLLNNGFSFAIFQAQQSTGQIPDTVLTQYSNAKAAGFSNIGVYIFPDSGKDPASQVQATLNYLKNNGIDVKYVWLDVEAPNLWSSSCSSNQAFLKTARQTIESAGYKAGIYTSESQWGPIMCGDTSFSDLPLWYAHYDNNPSFSDFSAFAGWSSPVIKQYAGDTSECGVSIDWDYAETLPSSCDSSAVSACLNSGGGNSCYPKNGCCTSSLDDCLNSGGGNSCYGKYCQTSGGGGSPPPAACDPDTVKSCLNSGGGNGCFPKNGCCNSSFNDCVNSGGGNGCYDKYCTAPSGTSISYPPSASPAACDPTTVNSCLNSGGGNACYSNNGCCSTSLNDCLNNGGGNACYSNYCNKPVSGQIDEGKRNRRQRRKSRRQKKPSQQ